MSDWPAPITEHALHGLAGEFVRLVEPHTEADPIALLIQLLVAFGVAAGRHAHLRIEASHHYPNEFCVLVGASGKGRKGSSWDHVEHLLRTAAPDFTANRLVSGLSSGEGLIAEVRDPLDHNDTTAPTDKRLLVLEPEFAQVMKVLAREGNTLSPVVRNSWDSKRLQSLVRNAPLRASAAHVGIVAHITKDELLRYLNATELANGFFNRFLLIAVKRSKLLPFGGNLTGTDLDRLKHQLTTALQHARTRGELTFDAEARERYSEIYEHLSTPHPGMFGAATGRAEAHTIRLALIYALLDSSAQITRPHLDAALALWRYSPRLDPLGVRRQPRRPHRRRHLGARQRTRARHQPHRSPRPLQPQQESPRDRPRPRRTRRRRPPPTHPRPRPHHRPPRRDLDPRKQTA